MSDSASESDAAGSSDDESLSVGTFVDNYDEQCEAVLRAQGAAKYGLPNELRRALEDGASPNAADITFSTRTLLHAACGSDCQRPPASLENSVECIRILLSAGADPCRADSWGDTPLHLTIRHGRAETVHMLIQAGADVHATERNEYTPLHKASYNGAADCVLPLLAAGASVNAPSNPIGSWPEWYPTPLDVACKWPHWGRRNREIWALLLRAGATIKPAESLPGGYYYPPYMRKIIDAGGFKAYEKASCKSFMALLAPKLPYHLPPEVVEIVVMFSFHVGFY